MSIYHCSIKIINRKGGRSAIASAAYRSGEKLYNEETGLTHDFNRKKGVVMSEILLPENAPERFLDREKLWNDVQSIEKRSDAQFAREIEVSLPIEMTRAEQIECVRKYIQENFVSKGMIADWALHDKDDGNPHAHIMLTIRGIGENKEWLAKQKSVFANARDEKGRPIFNPDIPSYNPKDKENTAQYRIPALDENGNQKKRVRKGKGTEYLWEKISIPANDWNEHANAEIWRASWAEHCNRYLDTEHKIDHRSYARQGINLEPTIHEGVVARNMEQNGKIAERCQINREIKNRNCVKIELKMLAIELSEMITEKARGIYERFRGITRSTSDFRETGADDADSGITAERNREPEQRESQLTRTFGRIHELKRTVERAFQKAVVTDRQIDNTEREIAITDQRITKIREQIQRKEADFNDRYQRLLKRRAALNASGGSGGTDLSSFLRELNIKERDSEEKRDDRIAERADRETQRERQNLTKERAVKKRCNRITEPDR